MFTLSLTTTFLATLQILLMGACGYFLTRKQIIDEGGLKLFSNLLINFFLPSFIFFRLLGSFSFARYPNWWIFPLISSAITLSGFLLGKLLVGLNPWIDFKKEFISLLTFQNSGYIPLILVATLFTPAQAEILYVYIFLFLIGFDLLIWSAGVWYLTRHQMEGFERKNLIHSPVVAIVVSLVLVFLGLQKFIPEFVMKPLKMFGDCTLPISMIVVGGNLARLKVPEIKMKPVVWVVAAKLIVLPALALLFLSVAHVDFLIGFLIILEAAVPSATTLSVIARHYNIEEDFINEGLVFSHLGCVVTIPVFLTLFNRLY